MCAPCFEQQWWNCRGAVFSVDHFQGYDHFCEILSNLAPDAEQQRSTHAAAFLQRTLSPVDANAPSAERESDRILYPQRRSIEIRAPSRKSTVPNPHTMPVGWHRNQRSQSKGRVLLYDRSITAQCMAIHAAAVTTSARFV